MFLAILATAFPVSLADVPLSKIAVPTAVSLSPIAIIPAKPFFDVIKPSGVIIPFWLVQPIIGAVPKMDLAPFNKFIVLYFSELKIIASFVCTKSSTAFLAIVFPASDESSFVLHAIFTFI